MNIKAQTAGARGVKSIMASLVRRVLADECGQVLPMSAVALFVLLGAAGLTIDVGRAYVLREQLQNSTNAAALAASGEVYNSSTTNDAQAWGQKYGSAAQADENYSSTGAATVTTTVTTKCLNMLMPGGSSCSTGSASNSVRVTQSATLKTVFMGLFGQKTLTVNTTATASMQGVAQPWNVAIIVDTTGSMANTDSDCGNLTELQCALSGVQALLQQINPCPAGVTSCNSSGANFRVSLFTFPNVLTSYNSTTVNSVSDDINCNGSPATYHNSSAQPVAAPYTLPKPGGTLPGAPNATYLTYTQTSTGKTWTATYQITPFLSDYYSSTASSGLSSSSNLVKAIGYGSTSGCLTYSLGIDGTGGGSGFGNTYLASSIYAAQSALIAEQAANPGSKNALIVLSDGDMNASDYSKNSSAYGTSNSTNQFVDATEFPEAPSGSEVGPTSSGYAVPAYYTPAKVLAAQNALGYDTLSSTSSGSGQTRSGSTKGTYPDWYDQCQQAIVAGQYASNHGTAVYAVAYGAGSSGCSSGWSVGTTDTTLVASGTNASFSLSQLVPCVTMENVATSLDNFYSDYTQSGSNSTCLDNAHSVSSLVEIFSAIAATFTNPRLLPNNAN
jgi:Flp pilus assembly protein TadG